MEQYLDNIHLKRKTIFATFIEAKISTLNFTLGERIEAYKVVYRVYDDKLTLASSFGV